MRTKNKTHRAVVYIIAVFVWFAPLSVNAEGNTSIDSFNKSKRLMMREVYSVLPKRTVYCDAVFNNEKSVINPNGFMSDKYNGRAERIEWEHVVPAENFGRNFVEWRDGHTDCKNSKGKTFKGRNCAAKVNMQFRYMYSDMYNLWPAIGAVNALRSNYNFAMIQNDSLKLGNCDMKIDSSSKKAEPPDYAKGIAARVYLYMDSVYPNYSISKQQRQLFEAWDKLYSVTKAECDRHEVIQRIQGNQNDIIMSRCFNTTGIE